VQENKKAENNFYHNDDTSTIEKKNEPRGKREMKNGRRRKI